jgi:hypothetical protein
MSGNNCTMMELYCLERAKSEPLNSGKWIAQAERWHDLSRAHDSWRFQKSPLRLSTALSQNELHQPAIAFLG